MATLRTVGKIPWSKDELIIVVSISTISSLTNFSTSVLKSAVDEFLRLLIILEISSALQGSKKILDRVHVHVSLHLHFKYFVALSFAKTLESLLISAFSLLAMLQKYSLKLF